MSAPQLLWITPKWPLPAEDGARQATVHLLQGLSEKGAQIHLVSIVPEGSTASHASQQNAFEVLGVKKITCLERKNATFFSRLADLLSHPLMPLTVAPYGSRAIAESFDKILSAGDFDQIVFDGLHTAAWTSRSQEFKTRQPRCVYRAHNVERDLWIQSAKTAKNPFLKILFQFQAWAMGRFERQISRTSHYVGAVSDLDRDRLIAAYSPAQCETIPIGVKIQSAHSADFPKHKEILFLGRLDWSPNRDGMIWFLENVWPEAAAKSPDLSLVIAGAGNGEWVKSYLSRPSHPRIRFLGRVAELAPLYRETVASIVPIFLGSGTRVKAIEASSYSRPCISTAIGVEGIGLDPKKSYFRAENREEWLQTLEDLSLAEAKIRGEKAHQHIVENFDPARVAEKFLRGIV